MWAQYFKDRVSSDIFNTMLHNSSTGITSVRDALAAIGSMKSFEDTFRDWSIANFTGDGSTVSLNPSSTEWSYSSIDTHGTHDGLTLSGLFPSIRQNVSTLQPLEMWSVNYYWYTPGTPPNGSVAWTTADPTDTASFIDASSNNFTFSLTSASTVNFSDTGYLIIQNPTGTSSATGDSVTHPAIGLNPYRKTPKLILEEANLNPALQELVRQTGKPRHICMDSYFTEKEKELMSKGVRPPF
jgi:hypothetical protein